MKSNSKKNIKTNYMRFACYIILFAVGFLLTILSTNILNFNTQIDFNSNDLDKYNLQTSAVWNSPITISGSSGWISAKSSGIVSTGDGSLDDPYIIEDHIFDLEGVNGIGLTIENSNDFFIIRNCIFKNMGSSSSIGINLQNVDNGKLIDNECSNQAGAGINGEDCQFITVSGNNVKNNYYGIAFVNANEIIITGNKDLENNTFGLYIVNCDNCMISQNTILNCPYGIALTASSSSEQCDHNVIVDNTITNENAIGYSYGIYIGYSSSTTRYNLVYRNNVQHNDLGIYIYADSNDIVENTVNLNDKYGITIEHGSINNKIIGNIINDNNDSGIFIAGTESYPCEQNIIGQNIINNNGQYGILIDWSSNNIITGNSLTGNANHIHENANCVNQNYIYDNVFPAPGLSLEQILIIIGIIGAVAAVITIIGIVIKKRH